MRRALAPLMEMLTRTRCAAILVRHLTKAQAADALYRGGGSIGIIGAARFGLLVGKDPDNEDNRIIAPTKCNIGPEPPSLRYVLEGVPGTDVARVMWDDEPSKYGANDLLEMASEDGDRTERDEAGEWLLDYLAGGPKPAVEVFREARKAGHADKTLKRAKKAVGVKSLKSAFGMGNAWAWARAEHAHEIPEGAI